MEKFLIIKYYYTSNNSSFLFSEIQVKIEDLLEDLFEDVNVYFHFINVSSSAYYNDFIEVEHNFTLYESKKNKIFSLIKANVSFSSEIDDSLDEAQIFNNFYEKKHYLKFAIFRKVTENNFFINDFDE